MEREVDNDRGKGCSINNVHLQLRGWGGGLEKIVHMYNPREFHPPENSYFVLFVLIASA